jgi:hypothetical protein
MPDAGTTGLTLRMNGGEPTYLKWQFIHNLAARSACQAPRSSSNCAQMGCQTNAPINNAYAIAGTDEATRSDGTNRVL